jgi:hypothetical protein
MVDVSSGVSSGWAACVGAELLVGSAVVFPVKKVARERSPLSTVGPGLGRVVGVSLCETVEECSCKWLGVELTRVNLFALVFAAELLLLLLLLLLYSPATWLVDGV